MTKLDKLDKLVKEFHEKKNLYETEKNKNFNKKDIMQLKLLNLFVEARKEITEIVLVKWFLINPQTAEELLALDDDLEYSKEIKIILNLLKEK